MKGLIVAYGKKDSLGDDRLTEHRGLMKIVGKEVVKYSLEKMREVGVKETLILVGKDSKAAYENALKGTDYKINIEVYQGSITNPAYVYIYGFSVLSREKQEEPILAVADDNLFYFPLGGLVNKFEEVNASVMAVRREEDIGVDITDLNLGRCILDENEKIIGGNYSFFSSEPVDSDIISLDIWLLHPTMIKNLLGYVKMGLSQKDIIKNCLGNFYAWEAYYGLWADVGKPKLRENAQDCLKSTNTLLDAIFGPNRKSQE